MNDCIHQVSGTSQSKHPGTPIKPSGNLQPNRFATNATGTKTNNNHSRS